jgi:murein DD-endopeptidase MepM/ murein hydrolase activator NlpD
MRSSTPTAIPGIQADDMSMSLTLPVALPVADVTLPAVTAAIPVRLPARKPVAKSVATTSAKKTATPVRKKKAKVSTLDITGESQLIIPVLGIKSSQLRDTYSDARGAGRKHDAIDIMAAHNTPVIAAADATVMKLDRGERGGITLYALGSDGKTVYYYAHLDHYEEGIKPGTHLNAGDVLGYVGDTGNAGPGNYHLHFEITTTSNPKRYWGGESHNPFPLLRKGITVTHY